MRGSTFAVASMSAMLLAACGGGGMTDVIATVPLDVALGTISPTVAAPVPFTVTNRTGLAVRIPAKCNDPTQIMGSPDHWNGSAFVKLVTICTGTPVFVTLENGESATSTVTFNVAARSKIEIDAQSVDGLQHFSGESKEFDVQ